MKNQFEFIVENNDMAPEYLKNDILIIENANEWENNRDYLVLLDGAITLKHIYVDGEKVILQDISTANTPVILLKKDISPLGVVRQLRRKKGNI